MDIPIYICSRLTATHLTLTATHLTLIYFCTIIRLSVPLGCLIKKAEIIIRTILNLWESNP